MNVLIRINLPGFSGPSIIQIEFYSTLRHTTYQGNLWFHRWLSHIVLYQLNALTISMFTIIIIIIIYIFTIIIIIIIYIYHKVSLLNYVIQRQTRLKLHNNTHWYSVHMTNEYNLNGFQSERCQLYLWTTQRSELHNLFDLQISSRGKGHLSIQLTLD